MFLFPFPSHPYLRYNVCIFQNIQNILYRRTPNKDTFFIKLLLGHHPSLSSYCSNSAPCGQHRTAAASSASSDSPSALPFSDHSPPAAAPTLAAAPMPAAAAESLAGASLASAGSKPSASPALAALAVGAS